jgi:succinate dehydrogenase / fumarate reductase, membrane anchor subunit
MVVNHRGLRDWMAQRITALLIGAYTIFILVYLLRNQPTYFAQWHGLFHHTFMKVFTFIVLLSVMWHAWIGLWTVFTDYVKNVAVRLTLEVLVILLLVGYLAWCFEIFWMSYQ